MQLTDLQKKAITALAERYSLGLLLLFGSRATGQVHSESDFDLAYASKRALTFEEVTRVNTDLIEIFRHDRIDLVDLKIAPPLLLKRIVDGAQVLYEREPHTFDDLYVRALKMYEEARVLFDVRRHYLARSLSMSL